MKKLKQKKMTACEAYVLRHKNFTRKEYARLRGGFEQGISWIVGVLAAKDGDVSAWDRPEAVRVIEAEKHARHAGADGKAYFALRVKLAEYLWKKCERHNLATLLSENGEEHLMEKLIKKYEPNMDRQTY
jgi:hypothetical protein